MNPESSFSRKLAIALIVCAVVGTEISYHFTLESRFDAIEQKLQQDTVAMRQMQDSLDTLSSSKTQTLAGLNKQVEALQSSFEPLGKMSREQTDAMSQVRQEIAVLQQAQNKQVDAQKQLSTGIAQLEKARNDARAAAALVPAVAPVAPAVFTQPATAATPAPIPVPVTAAPASESEPFVTSPSTDSVVPVPASALVAPRALPVVPSTTRHSTKIALLPSAPNASDAMDLRPADSSSGDTFRSVRAVPVGDSIAR
jgi:hypothetical protein